MFVALRSPPPLCPPPPSPRSPAPLHLPAPPQWGARNGGPNFMGSVYLNELALDLALQLLLSGVAPTPGYAECTHA